MILASLTPGASYFSEADKLEVIPYILPGHAFGHARMLLKPKKQLHQRRRPNSTNAVAVVHFYMHVLMEEMASLQKRIHRKDISHSKYLYHRRVRRSQLASTTLCLRRGPSYSP